MKFDYPDWSSVHHPHWKALLDKHLDLTQSIRMVEVGCFEGRSTVWFADYLAYHGRSRLICIDSWMGGEEVKRINLGFDMNQVFCNFWDNIQSHPQRDRIFMHRGKSEHMLGQLMHRDVGTYDFVYLDGSHTQRDTLVDLTVAILLIRKGGLIIVDDYLNHMATDNPKLRPRDAVNFIVDSFGDELEFSLTPEKQAVIVKR